MELLPLLPDVKNPRLGDIFYNSSIDLPDSKILVYGGLKNSYHSCFVITAFLPRDTTLIRGKTKRPFFTDYDPYLFDSQEFASFSPLAHSSLLADRLSTFAPSNAFLKPPSSGVFEISRIENSILPAETNIEKSKSVPAESQVKTIPPTNVFPGDRFSRGNVVAFKNKSVKFVVTGIGLYKLLVVDYDDATQPSVEMTLNISPDLEIVQP